MLRSVFFFLAFALTTACARDEAQFVLTRPGGPIDAEIVQDIVALLGPNARISIRLSEDGHTDESALDALVSGEADLALVSNNMPFRPGISTVLPLYPTVLHIGYIGERQFASPVELFRGANIFAGPEGSASRMMFERFTSRSGIAPADFTYVEDPESQADVFVVFAPISPDRLTMYPDIRLLSAGSPEDIGKGAGVDAATLMNPQLRPFVIPVGTYGAATPEPILTVAVDMLLVARSDLSESVIYDLVRELSSLRPALASQRPGLFQRLSEDFNTGNSTFVLHPGLVAYLDRNEPSVYERYSGVAEVVVTLIVALFSASFAGVRIFRMRRKNRIDTFYTDVIAIRGAIGDSASDVERADASRKIRALQKTAFELLVDEKLSADESFRIFISLSNDALRDLGPTHPDTHVSES